MIELHQISKVFNRGRPDEMIALTDISLALKESATTVLMGPSGSGKTTLLGIVGCMARPTAGRIFLNRREITSLPERFRTDIRRRTFGFIFQQFHLIRGITAIENVIMPAYTTGESYGSLRRRAMDLLARLDLAGRAESRMEWLSGGEAQRVAIARALINDPSVIIADEPTAHLDTKLSMEFLSIMADLKAEGRTLIMASHDPLVCESSLVDRVVRMRDGRLLGPADAADAPYAEKAPFVLVPPGKSSDTSA